jgi:hypothetical protein
MLPTVFRWPTRPLVAGGLSALATSQATARRLFCTAGLALLGCAASAQNAPAPAAAPTGDQVLYGRQQARCTCRTKQPQAQPMAQTSCPSRHELRLKRDQYLSQHRAEFPATYQPGVE